MLQNSDPIIRSLSNTNKNRAKSIATFYFLTLYTKLPHDKLKPKLSSIVDFAFKGGNKAFVRLSNNEAAYWGTKTKVGIGFSKTSLKTAINHLIENCYFNVGNVKMKQAIGIPTRNDPSSFWANLFLYSHEEKYMPPLTSFDKSKARHDLCPINDSGDFGRSTCDIYPKEFELK